MAENQTVNINSAEEKVWTIPFIMVFLNSMVVTSTQWAVAPMMSSYCIDLGASLKTASVVSTLMSMTAMFLPISFRPPSIMTRTLLSCFLAIKIPFCCSVFYIKGQYVWLDDRNAENKRNDNSACSVY